MRILHSGHTNDKFITPKNEMRCLSTFQDRENAIKLQYTNGNYFLCLERGVASVDSLLCYIYSDEKLNISTVITRTTYTTCHSKYFLDSSLETKWTGIGLAFTNSLFFRSISLYAREQSCKFLPDKIDVIFHKKLRLICVWRMYIDVNWH